MKGHLRTLCYQISPSEWILKIHAAVAITLFASRSISPLFVTRTHQRATAPGERTSRRKKSKLLLWSVQPTAAFQWQLPTSVGFFTSLLSVTRRQVVF